MNILTIPLRNSRRKWPRTLLLLAVFTLGVTSVVALNLVSRVVAGSLEKKLTAYGANILVAPRTETLTVSYGGFHMGDMLFDVQYLDEAETVATIRSIELKDRISAVAPKLVAMTTVDNTAVGVVGVRWDEELAIKNHWAVTGRYPGAEQEVLAGARAAELLGLAPGDKVELNGNPFLVAGVLDESGGEDDNVILGDLGYVQTVFDKPGQVNFIEVAALCSGCPIDDIVAQMAGKLPGTEITALRNVVEQRMYSVRFVERLAMTVSLVLLLTACCMVGLSMLSSVSERKKEIGVLRSLGFSRGHVFGVFFLEALFIGLVAGAVGYLAGFGASFKALSLLEIAGDAEIAFHPWFFAAATGGAMLIAGVSAALPALKAARIEPSEALVSL